MIQEILQGLDVVHEVEEDSAYDVKAEKLNDKGTLGDLEKRERYPYIKNKGKE